VTHAAQTRSPTRFIKAQPAYVAPLNYFFHQRVIRVLARPSQSRRRAAAREPPCQMGGEAPQCTTASQTRVARPVLPRWHRDAARCTAFLRLQAPLRLATLTASTSLQAPSAGGGARQSREWTHASRWQRLLACRRDPNLCCDPAARRRIARVWRSLPLVARVPTRPTEHTWAVNARVRAGGWAGGHDVDEGASSEFVRAPV
jgi:hypothetical protein